MGGPLTIFFFKFSFHYLFLRDEPKACSWCVEVVLQRVSRSRDPVLRDNIRRADLTRPVRTLFRGVVWDDGVACEWCQCGDGSCRSADVTRVAVTYGEPLN